MTRDQFLKLQIGMYVTDAWDAFLRCDYKLVQQFDRNGRMKLQPLGDDGEPSGDAHWVHYSEYTLYEKLYKSEYLMETR